jgi:branched-chain amino acid transport system substrate-binding protein
MGTWTSRRLAALVALALSLAACGGNDQGNGGQTGQKLNRTIKVGFVDVQSGPAAYLGQYELNSIKVEVDRINKAGGLLGAQLEVVSRDDELKADKAVTQVRELTSGDQPVDYLIGPGITGPYQAAKSVIDDAGIPNCLSLVSGGGAFNHSSAPYSFRTLEPDALRIEPTIGYLGASGTKKVGMVYENDATGQGLDAAIKPLAGKYGIDYVGVEYSSASDPTNVNQVRALLDKGIDTLLISNVLPGSANSVNAVARLGATGKLKVFGWSGLRGVSFVDAAYPNTKGVVLMAGYSGAQTDIPQSQWPAAYRKHVQAVTQQFGIDTAPKSGASSYKGAAEAAQCIVNFEQAVKKAKSIDHKKVLSAMESLDIPADQAPMGIHITYSSSSHETYAGKQFYVYQWETGADGKYLMKQVATPSDVQKDVKS